MATQVFRHLIQEKMRNIDVQVAGFLRRVFLRDPDGFMRETPFPRLVDKWLSMEKAAMGGAYLSGSGCKLFFHASLEMAKAFHLGSPQQKAYFFLEG
eukprot:GSA120T00003593001.1